MTTWHQAQNSAAVQALWAPHATKWKCVSDRPGRMASCMSFDDEASALAYAGRTGDTVIPPRGRQP